ncbi:fungal-specific transcription factor domain-containing protein [Sphaerosporella brunnea]|uniref:Fungal-specific transcription factor domain-containing protein n=1 Tax=Sphaerosporella brunnea TaxID=1250544 RepID=A0A5J5F8U3_9PEZI|nr:fungal-specific transcription factor domain-containing protein [Sphaerosporella brunnea]
MARKPVPICGRPEYATGRPFLPSCVDPGADIHCSYVHYLETRVAYLESLLTANNVAFSPADDFPDLPPIQTSSSALPTPTAVNAPPLPTVSSPTGMPIDPALQGQSGSGRLSPRIKRESSEALDGKKLDSLVSDIGLVSFAGASDPRYLGSVSGISFARVVFAAVKSSTPGGSEQSGGEQAKGRHKRIGSTSRSRGSRGLGMGGAATKEEPETEEDADTQMRDSFFGLHTKPSISPAPFPTRPVAERLVRLYFEHANPQIPSLHRGEFNDVVEAIYRPVEDKASGSSNGVAEYDVQGTGLGGTARERYLLLIVCAIGAGIFLAGPEESSESDDEEEREDGPRKKQKVDSNCRPDKPKQSEPEAYHASAMLQLESFLGQSKGGLDELQAVLLLAGYALLRPVSPGLWYIVGVAVRLAVDLGLHYEDAESEAKKPIITNEPKTEKEAKKEWVRDMRRRLWWCVYNLDRLVSTCVGRPFGIADEVISTQFPSMLDDEYIHPTKGFMQPPPSEKPPTYKTISNHYTRLRLLQSEILQVLQQQSHAFSFASASSETAFKRDMYKGKQNYPRHHPYHLQTPYLHNHKSLQVWHRDVDRRLQEWIDTAPKTRAETGVDFSPEFLELNYWQAKIMLYRPCLSVPVLLAGELGANSGSSRSRAAERGFGEGSTYIQGRHEDEGRVFMIVAEAGAKVLRIYRQLHRVHQVNYTFLATHHLFMAGISFLYAIWHSPLVRSRLSMDEVDFTILAATSVLGDLVDVCPPAAACRDAFERMSRATVQMCMSGKKGPASLIVPSGTFSSGQTAARQSIDQQERIKEENDAMQQAQQYRPVYQGGQPTSHISPTVQQMMQRPHSRSSSADSFSQHSQAQARRQPVHFDDGFRELFTSPRPRITPTSYPPQQPHQYVQSPVTTAEDIQYHPSVYAHSHPQHIYPQPHPQSHAEMMIDPALQQRYAPAPPPSTPGDWSNMDMSHIIPEAEMWEHDSWSDEGNTGQVDLFDGFFFGGQN